MSTPGELLGALGREARARLGNGRGGSSTRVYRGRTVEELIPRIERELGPEAIVLRRREGLTGGVLGFFQHPWVELEAVPGTPGLDIYDDPENAEPPDPAGPGVPPPAPPAAGEAAAAVQPGPAPASLVMPRGSALPASYGAAPAPAQASAQAQAAPVTAPGAIPPPVPVRGGEELFDQPGGSAYVTAHLAALARATPAELRAQTLAPAAAGGGSPPVTFAIPAPAPPAAPRRPARTSSAPPPGAPVPPSAAAPAQPPQTPLERPAPDLRELIPEQRGLPPAPLAPPPPADWPARAATERRTVQPGSHARARAGVEKGLARYGIGEALAGELIDMAMAHVLPLAPRAGLAAAVRSTLAQRIPVAPPLGADGASIVLVGAGGAGKTTCCAALLSAYRSGSTLPASFATLVQEGGSGPPEWRLLMSPQLLKPAPIETARAVRALRRARGGGLAVLDTPRISPADRRAIRGLGRLLGQLDPDRVLLALPATLGRAAAAQLLGALGPLKADALVVTHADETDQIGVAIEAACRFGLAPEYMLTHGRGGGWQLRRLDPAGLAAMVLP